MNKKALLLTTIIMFAVIAFAVIVCVLLESGHDTLAAAVFSTPAAVALFLYVYHEIKDKLER